MVAKTSSDSGHGVEGENWYGSAWQYRQKITIDHTKVEDTLTNFPVLITEANIKDAFWGHVKEDGSDIVVTASDGTTKLKRELVSIDTSSKVMELWVKVPTLASDSDTEIYLYYGNPSASETDDEDTWDEHFVAVYHMKDDPDSSHIKDSTANGNNGTKKGSGEPSEADGRIGKGQDFDEDYVNCGNKASFNNLTEFTYELWIKFASTADNQTLLNQGAQVNSPHAFFFKHAGGQLFLEVGYTDGRRSFNPPTAPSWEADKWYHLVATFLNDGETAIARFCLDGDDIGYKEDTDGYDFNTGSHTLYIGAYCGIGLYFNGRTDEVRVSDIARSLGWQKTCFNNQDSPSTFYSVGSEELGAILAGIISGSETGSGLESLGSRIFASAETGSGIGASSLLAALIGTEETGLGSELGTLVGAILAGDEGSGFGAVRALIEMPTTGSDMRLPPSPGQAGIPSKEVNL